MEAGSIRNRKVGIAFLSIALHCLLLFFIFFDLKHSLRQLAFPEAAQETKRDWATRNSGKSRFGAPVIFKSPPQPASQQKQALTQTKLDKPHRAIKTKRAVVQKRKEQRTQKKEETVKQKAQKREQSSNTKDRSTQVAQKTQLPTKLTMANLLKGFLEQTGSGSDSGLRHKGSNKQPPDEQIKYERYAQKIHWCIQNTFRINKHKLLLPHAVRSLMQLYIEFQDNGLIKEVKLIQASGSPQLDQFMIDLIKDAGKSFPPFPKFLDKNLLPKVYTLQVDIPAATRGSNLMMSV